MLTHFIIDGAKHPVKDVLEGRVPSRFPLSYLELAADFRAWDGKPHVTDLFNGARLHWLKHKTDYAIDPEDAAYRVLGVQAHGKLEQHVSPHDVSELGLETDDLQGRTDLISQINGELALADYKVVGSYKIQQALGIYYESVPLFEDGKPVLFKSGMRKGEQKTRKEMRTDPKKADMKDFIRQLNIYRRLYFLMYEKAIKKMYIFAIVRDGGTMAARQRGVVQKTYTFEIPMAPDEMVDRYIKTKSEALVAAMSGDIVPPMCNPEECWNGRRCKEYCEVSEACAKIGDNPYLLAEESEEE